MLGGFILADVNGSNVNVTSLFCSHGISIFQPSLLAHLRTIKTISGNSMSIKCIFRWHIRTHKTCTTRTSSRSACLLDAFSFQGHKKKYKGNGQLRLQSLSTQLSCGWPQWWLPQSHVSYSHPGSIISKIHMLTMVIFFLVITWIEGLQE